MIGTFSIVMLFFSISFFILFLYSLSKQRNGLSALFACVCLTISIYIGGYAAELHSGNIRDILFALKAEYFGAPFMSAFWLLLSYKFLFRKSASPNLTLLVMTIPFITLFLSVTNDYHHLIYTRVTAFIHDGYVLARLEKGSWYYVNLAYAYAAQLFGFTVFFRAWRAKNYQTGNQAFWMLCGSLWPGLLNLFYIAGSSPLDLDPTPLGLSISGVFFCVAIFRYGFLDLQQIVKDVIFLEIDEGILIIDGKNRLLDYNQACRAIFSWLEPKNIGMDAAAFPEWNNILLQQDSTFEMTLPVNGSHRYFEFRSTPLAENKTVLGKIYFIRDITKQKEMIQALHDIANYDSLTEIYNRRSLMEQTEKELRHMQRYGSCLSVLMIDIDHFKRINDQYGHQAGDEVLKALSLTCLERIRQTDIIGRYGGEEFMIVLPETNEENAINVAEVIRKCIERMDFLAEDHTIHITVSIGIKTVYNYEEPLTLDGMIHHADLALYRAKKNGRNQISTVAE